MTFDQIILHYSILPTFSLMIIYNRTWASLFANRNTLMQLFARALVLATHYILLTLCPQYLAVYSRVAISIFLHISRVFLKKEANPRYNIFAKGGEDISHIWDEALLQFCEPKARKPSYIRLVL